MGSLRAGMPTIESKRQACVSAIRRAGEVEIRLGHYRCTETTRSLPTPSVCASNRRMVMADLWDEEDRYWRQNYSSRPLRQGIRLRHARSGVPVWLRVRG